MKVRDIRYEDITEVIKWNKDEFFCSANGWPLDRTDTELKRWWHNCVEKNKEQNFKRIAIIMDNKMIGYGDLAEIHESTAEIGIAIGDSSLWGQGIGEKALQNIMQFGTVQLGLTTYFAETHTTNKRAQALLKKLKFEEISREGQEFYLGEVSGLIQYKRHFS